MKVYIAGPMRGLPDGNRAEFHRAEVTLKLIGHVPVNPHSISPSHFGPCRGPALNDPTQPNEPHLYGCYMLTRLMTLLGCEGYSLLPGWGWSNGAVMEHEVAKICGLELVSLGWRTYQV